MPRGLLVLLLVLLAGCGRTPRAVRLEVAGGNALVVTPRAQGKPVALDVEDFQKAVAEQAQAVRPAERPLERARQHFGWIVAEEKLAAALKALFAAGKLKIEVVHIPPHLP
jgi:hypothetical protein